MITSQTEKKYQTPSIFWLLIWKGLEQKRFILYSAIKITCGRDVSHFDYIGAIFERETGQRWSHGLWTPLALCERPGWMRMAGPVWQGEQKEGWEGADNPAARLEANRERGRLWRREEVRGIQGETEREGRTAGEMIMRGTTNGSLFIHTTEEFTRGSKEECINSERSAVRMRHVNEKERRWDTDRMGICLWIDEPCFNNDWKGRWWEQN